MAGFLSMKSIVNRIMGCVAVYLCWIFIYPTYYERFRLDLEIAVDGEVKKGSSVIQVAWIAVPTWLPGSNGGFNVRVTGTAPQIKLGDDQYLYALLDRDGSQNWMKQIGSKVFKELLPDYTVEYQDNIKQLSKLRASKALTSDQMPLLAAFSDIKDVRTLVVVDIGRTSMLFGKTISLISVRMTMTNEAPSRVLDPPIPDMDVGSDFARWRHQLPSSDIRSRLTTFYFIENGKP